MAATVVSTQAERKEWMYALSTVSVAHRYKRGEWQAQVSLGDKRIGIYLWHFVQKKKISCFTSIFELLWKRITNAAWLMNCSSYLLIMEGATSDIFFLVWLMSEQHCVETAGKTILTETGYTTKLFQPISCFHPPASHLSLDTVTTYTCYISGNNLPLGQEVKLKIKWFKSSLEYKYVKSITI